MKPSGVKRTPLPDPPREPSECIGADKNVHHGRQKLF